ncbi:MAG: energy-coupling factor ABC transporter ATP-binding protein [Candidatus Dormibacteraeota bacterium]|nr:energy-coupling factor ABC transporter ATP-binding protein [Candidatus Dormibacteraeota bacterium]
MIDVRGLSHTYGDGTQALTGVSFSVAAGEVVSLTGPMGSGKSTLLRHLNGLLRPSRGQVWIEGRDARTLRVAQLSRRVGIAFQEPDHQLFKTSVRDEIAFAAAGLERVELVLDWLGLRAAARRHPLDLGYSRRKLVAIAAVVAMATPIVVLDEPGASQDRAGLDRLINLLTSLRKEGRTVLFAGHRRELSEVADRGLRLDSGRLTDG